VIKSFRHKGLQRFFETGKTSEIQPAHAKRIRLQLAALDTARSIDDMDIPGFRLQRKAKKRWSIRVNGNWRLTFAFDDGDVNLLDYEDYH
jgi:proteic killer suppression protein